MPRGEAGDDREGDELDDAAQLGQAQGDQDDARHHGGDDQAVDAVLLHDAVDDHDERAGGPADLHPGAAQRRDQEAGDDRGVEALLRGDAAGDGEGDGEREGDDADDDAGEQVVAELSAV